MWQTDQGTKWVVVGLLACMGLLNVGRAEAAKGGVPQCTADLGVCQTQLTDAQGDLTQCTNDLTSCEAATCGNGIAEFGEECDGEGFQGATCVSQGFLYGTLACSGSCTLNTSGCTNARFVDNPDGTITDHQTGLMWEKKSGGSSTAFDSQGVGNCLNCVNDPYSWPGAMSEWLSALNGRTDDWPYTQPGYAGYSDWRLPTIVELQTILDTGAGVCGGESGPCVNTIFNDSDSFTAVDVLYWSSTSFAATPWGALGVHFVNGDVGGNYKGFGLHVRAVRGAP